MKNLLGFQSNSICSLNCCRGNGNTLITLHALKGFRMIAGELVNKFLEFFSICTILSNQLLKKFKAGSRKLAGLH